MSEGSSKNYEEGLHGKVHTPLRITGYELEFLSKLKINKRLYPSRLGLNYN